MITLKAFGGGKRRPINLFFAEIIIALLFFSISGAVILKVFASAELKSQQSARLERVIIFAQSFAEAYSESGSVNEAARLVLGTDGNVGEGGDIVLFLEDGNVNMHTSEKREPTGAGELSELTMTFTADGGEIYSLTCSAYIRNGGEPNE